MGGVANVNFRLIKAVHFLLHKYRKRAPKRILSLLLFLSIFLLNQPTFAQNTSNEGTDFWVAYTGHVDGTNSRLTLFITAKVNASVNVIVGGVPYAGNPVQVLANQAVPVYINPNVYTNVYIDGEGTLLNRGIHVTATAPIILYSHISNAARSAATLVLPTRALGNEYYAMAYNQMPSITGINAETRVSEFTLVGVENSTRVKFSLPVGVNSIANTTYIGGFSYEIDLNQGDVFQFQSTKDVTGVKITTVGACKPLAVFSGSTKAGFCDDPGSIIGNGQDNLYQQLFPVTTWGKNYLTAPFYNALNGVKDIIRIVVATDNTTVTVNGSTTTANGIALTNPYAKGSIITFSSSTPNTISSTEPISVAQIQVSSSCNPNNYLGRVFISANQPFPGDPEMTILNPIEQTLTDITLYSAISVTGVAPTNIRKHYINVILKTADIPVFTIDNATIPASQFVTIDGQYSYLIKDVTTSSATNPTHRIKAPDGFIAIAYGYGDFESYAYLAGADIKNLNQFIQVRDPISNTISSSACVGQSFTVETTLPYPTTELRWDLADGQPEIIQMMPIFDRQYVQDGVTLYVYKLPTPVSYLSAGTKNVVVKAINPAGSLCGGVFDSINLAFEVHALPAADFLASPQACVGAGVTFEDRSTLNGTAIRKWIWNFDDGTANRETLVGEASFLHQYATPGDYLPTLTLITQDNCSITSVPQPVHISALPIAKFNPPTTPLCEQNSILFTNLSTPEEGTIITWKWDFGDGQQSPLREPAHTYVSSGTYLVSLTVKTNLGCEATYTESLVVAALPVVDFEVPDFCLSDVSAGFTNLATNADGTINNLIYAWDFGDATQSSPANPNTSNSRNPSHNYSLPGDYLISLTVTTAVGCSKTKTKIFRVNGINPIPDFEVVNATDLCSSNAVAFVNKSSVPGFGDITRLEWYFDYLNQPTYMEFDESPIPNKAYPHQYPISHSQIPLNYTVRLLAFSGGVCVNEIIKVITVKGVPEVRFTSIPDVCQENSPFQLTQATELHGFAGFGNFTGPGVSSSGMFNPSLAGVGTHTITYTFTAANACSSSATSTITVYATPIVNAGRDTTILEGGTLQLQPQVSGTGLTYQWTPITNLSDPTSLNPIASPDLDVLYTLRVTSSEGCVAADNIFIRVLQLPEIPNAFTPNADGYNDVWNIRYLNSYTNPTVQIFNRYGQQVYYSVGYATPWDGRFNGEDLPMGTYYYIVNPGNGRKVMAGSVTLIK
jgi:gliding motility-associated-like protein